MFVTKLGLENLRGTFLIAVLTSVCSTGFCLFGYDQGVMSGVVISKYWLDTMGNPSTIMLSTITAIYDVGAVFGAIAAAFSSEPLGRKRTLILGASILLVGTILMGTCVERIQMIVARIVTGVGKHGLSRNLKCDVSLRHWTRYWVHNFRSVTRLLSADSGETSLIYGPQSRPSIRARSPSQNTAGGSSAVS